MSSPLRFYHTVAGETIHEACAVYDPSSQLFTYKSYDLGSTRRHEHYFETLADFVDWHYRQQGVEPVYNTPAADEVKVSVTQAQRLAR